MIYTYRCDATGETVERQYPIGQAPEIIGDQDKMWRLQITAPAVKVVGGTGANYVKR